MDHKHRLARLARLAAAGPEKIAAAALALFGLIAFAVTVVAVVESYANLVAFSLAHGILAWHGAIAPVAVDSFIVMGELLLFAGILLHWEGRALYGFAGGLVVGGFAMSVGGNVFRAAPLPVPVDRAIQAIWPVTATAALTGCLIIIKRIMAGRGAGRTAVPAPAAEKPSPVPSSRQWERRRPVTGKGSARTAGLVAASDHENQVAERLAAAGGRLPSIRVLADSDFGGSIHKSRKTLKLAAARMNGHGSDGA